MSCNDAFGKPSAWVSQEAWWKGRSLRPKNRDDQPEVFWTRAVTAIEDARTHTSASNENGPSLSLMLSDSEFELITRDSAVTKDVAAALQ